MIASWTTNIFGRYLKTMGVDMRVEGAQEFFTKLAGVADSQTPSNHSSNTTSLEDESDMKFFVVWRVYEREIFSTFKTFKASEFGKVREQDQSFLQKMLPKKFLLWQQMARSINEEMKMEARKVSQ